MSCFQHEINIPGDETGSIKKMVIELAEGNMYKASAISSFFGSERFAEFLEKATGEKDYKVLRSTKFSTLRRLTREFYKNGHLSVFNSANKRQGNAFLFGFNNVKDMQDAEEHTIVLIIDEYLKAVKENTSPKKVLTNVANEIVTNFIDKYGRRIWDSIPEDNAYKQFYKEAFENNAKQREKLNNEIEELKEERKALKDKELKQIKTNEIKTRLSEITQYNNELFDIIYGAVVQYGDVPAKVYSKLALQMLSNPNAWFDKVFGSNKINRYKRIFEGAIDNANINIMYYEDDSNFFNSDPNDDIDLESRRWEDNGNTSFTENVELDVKLYLASIKRITSPDKVTINGKETWAYDYGNSLGTTSTVGADFLLAQLYTVASKYSLPMFIESIKRASQRMKGLECLAIIAEDCIKDEEFANRLFHELSGEVVEKTIIDIDGNYFKNGISNSNANPISVIYYNLENIAKFTIDDAYNEYDIDLLTHIKNFIAHNNINAIVNDYNTDIKRILFKYFPQLDVNSIDAYLSGGSNIAERYENLINDVIDLINNANFIITEKNKLVSAYSKKLYEYKKTPIDPQHPAPKPIMNYEAIPYDKLKRPLINIASKLADYMSVKSELNSFNAQGNMGSDLLSNNHIINLIKQIQFGTEKDADYGLRKLGEFVLNIPQYKHSPIFWGITNAEGKVVVNGLFTRTTEGFTINPNAKKILSISLFNGVRNINSNESQLYNTMSKNDYFLSSIIAFHNPALSITQYGMTGMASYFLRTPSDAPKNFTLNAPKILYDGLFEYEETAKEQFAVGLWNKVKGYFNNKTLNPTIKKDNVGNKLKEGYQNSISFNELIDMVTNIPETFDATGYQPIGNTTNKTITFIANFGDKYIRVRFSATTTDPTSKLLSNLKYEGFYTNASFQEDSNGKTEWGNLLKQHFIDYGIQSGQIARKVNTNHSLFYGFRQQLLNEINNFVFNLNNVFDYNNDYNTKTDTNGLFDQYHIKKGELVSDGRLVGNIFKFNRLFDTTNYKAGEVLETLLSLYGGKDKALFIKRGDNKLQLNINHPLISVNAKTGVISLNQSFINDILTEVTTNWLNSYLQDIQEIHKEYASVLEDNFSKAQVEDAIINTTLMYMNYDDLFEGDSKFYKSSRDFLKRAKEIQASGKSYSAIDFNGDIGGEYYQLVDNNNKPKQIVIKQGEKDIIIPIRNGFKGVTIKNTVRPSDHADKIYDEILKVNSHLPESTRKRVATQIAKGFKLDTKTNDAQSYITIEEFLRRAYLSGEYHYFKDIAAELLNPDADISKIDIGKINKLIQVQKNFYFDRQFDKNTQTVYARQIKNAEFVLIPSLIKGTSLETLYNIMKENGIDQINTAETDKAAKRVVLEFWDNNGKVTEEAKNKFTLDSANTNNQETYYYRYLYKQQSVAQHMQNQRNKAGIQIMKKLLDNASPEIRKHIDNFFNAYIANIHTDFNSFLTSMGWRVYNGKIVDAKTNETIKFDKFYKRAKEEAERLGLDSNFADYCTLDKYGEPIMPDYMNIAVTKFQSIAQSMFNNNVLRQTLPGWHAAQITSVGYDANLKFDPETGIMEVLLPRWAVGKGKEIPKVKRGSEEEKKLLEELNKEGLDLHIGYRIPTEGKQSVAILKVVGFLDDVQGSTIVVPDEWVTKTGSDFDVDSVYGICFQHKVDPKTGEISKIKPIIGENENYNEPTADTNNPAFLKRYRDYIRAELKKLLDNDKQAVFDALSFDNFIINNTKQVLEFLKSDSRINILVDKLGIMGKNRFASMTVMEQQLPEARNNIILQAMIDIMSSSTTREENYSRSNFDNLTDANAAINKLRKAYENNNIAEESVYSPKDQINYMENAMSGASLKAFSVTRDTFNSVANFTKAELNESAAVTVIYDLTAKDKDGNLIYDENIIKAAYGEDAKPIGKDKIKVTHRKFAWSNNNRNVVGMLLTPYSSQTTAHILDAIKEGSIFNENKFTFGTFKTLIDLGIDYETAIAFLQQPAVTEIVKAYNEINSVYANVQGRPIEVALARIVKAAGINNNGKPISDRTSQYTIFKILSSDNRLQNAIKKLTGGQINENGMLVDGVFTLDGNRLKQRFSEPHISESEKNYSDNVNIDVLAHDILTLLHFAQIYNNTAKLEKVIRCTNPDKFGAKQSVFATRTVITNIKKYIDKIDENYEIGNIIQVNGEPLLKHLYPNIENDDININQSVYPYLAAFLKYVTMSSIEINKQLFSLEEDAIYDRMLEVQTALGINFNDEKADIFKKYIVTDVYNSVSQFFTPYIVENGFYMPADHKSLYGENSTFWSDEIDRIHGYKQYGSINLEIADINNPTKDEIINFAKLTPAQKVVWIKNNFKGIDGGIINYINVNHFKNKDILRYNDALGNIEDLFIAFNASFFNSNPLVKLTALDLIKYAFVVESFNFKKGAISKIITNDSLLASFEETGVMGINTNEDGIVNAIKSQFDNHPIDDKFIEKFVRSHSNLLKTIKIGKPHKGSFSEAFLNSLNVGAGILHIADNNSEYSKILRNNLGIKVTQDGIVAKNNIRYIKVVRPINKKTETIVYKLIYAENDVYGYPLNLLDSSETYEVSYNNDNNKFLHADFYTNAIQRHITNGNINGLNINDFKIPSHETETIDKSSTNINYFDELRNNGSAVERSTIDLLYKQIDEWLKGNIFSKDSLLVNIDSRILSNIVKPGVDVIQNITIEDNTFPIKISRYKLSSSFKKELRGVKDNKRKQPLIDIEQDLMDRIGKDNKNPIVYKVELLKEDKLEPTDNTQDDSLMDDDTSILYSDLGSIDDTDLIIEHPFDSINQTAKDIVDTIYSEHRHGRTEKSNDFVNRMNEIGLDNYNTDSVRNHSKDIFKSAATYYTKKAEELRANINNFVLDDENDVSYSIDDKDLYDILEKYPNKYNELIKLILDCYTFGNQFSTLTLLDVKGEDVELTADIEKLRNAINSIQNNIKVKQAMNNIFNIYLSKLVSKNPLLGDIFISQGRTHGLLNLNKTFNDTGWFDSQISDIGFINNKQVQVVVKYINSQLNGITRFEIPEILAKFDREFEEIMNMAGSLDWNNIVDENGYLVKPYTKEFVEKRNELLKRVKEARDKSLEEYWAVKLEKDKWFAENTNQPIVADYYKEKNANERFAFEQAKPEFIAYQKILAELREISGNAAELSREQLVRRKDLLNELNLITSRFDSQGNEKPADARRRINILKDYIERKKAIREKYFNTKILDDVKSQIDSYVEYIRNYDSNNPDLSLQDKLLDEYYKEAYEWLELNTTKVIDKESNDKLLEAYAIMNREETNRKVLINEILKGKDVYDDTGRLDPTKISNEDAAKIKKLYETEETEVYEDLGYDSRIIKVVGKPDVVGKDEYYNTLKELFGDASIDPEKTKYITRINNVLIKGIDENGKLSIQKLFTDATVEDLNYLFESISKYLAVPSSVVLSESGKAKLKKVSTVVVPESAKEQWKQDKIWAKQYLNEDKFTLFKRMFGVLNRRGRLHLTNAPKMFYGYRIPVKKYTDLEKSKAKALINDNISYRTIDSYEVILAAKKAEAEATNDESIYNDWYKANHIYNPYTHKMEPINIWRERVINPTGSLNATYEYNPSFEFTESEVKEEFVNDNFNPDDAFNYNGVNYRNPITQNAKEKAMHDFVNRILTENSKTPGMTRRANEGFMPRKAKDVKNNSWYFRQAIGSLGIEWTSYRNRNWSDNISYETDRDGDFNMLSELRKKGSVDLKTITPDKYATTEEYENALKEAKENNQKIDNEIRDNDWPSILRSFVQQASLYNAKESLKNTSLLLIEDLKHQNAIKINHRDNVSMNRKRSTSHNEVANEIAQTNTLEIVKNWHRRMFRNEFKKKHNLNEAASLMQNITSAKYMIFNVTGGIANVWTGLGNILGETLAGDFFSNKDFAAANSQYAGNIVTFFAEMYSDKSSSLTNALIKRFNVVDYEAMSERKKGEGLSTYVTRVRNLMYGLQSGGEHYMQNTALLAMLKSHRVYTNYKGKTVIGSYNNYIEDIERGVLQNLIDDNVELKHRYIVFLSDIQNSDSELYKYDTLQKNIVTEFVRNQKDKEFTKKFIKAKEEALKDAERRFNADTNPTVESLFELKDGVAVLKENSPITNTQLGALVNKTIYVNKKIHGVYDKIGSAQIEKYWWGTLVMQYHKHLYPGFMKRWRLHGYFNEQLEAHDKGSYISAMNLLTIDFDKAIKTAKDDAEGQKAKMLMKSVQNIAIQALNNIQYIKMNYALLPKWEQNNIKRSYADSINTLACITMAIGIHACVNEDELKDSNLLSTAVYLADRFASEAQAFTPWGAYGEAKTLYSSPIASLNSPGDLIKLIGLTGQLLFDPEFETNYSTGLYKGRNKFEVVLTRNIPIVRVKNRLEMMSKNNQYYRLNQNMLKLIPVQDIGHAIGGIK